MTNQRGFTLPEAIIFFWIAVFIVGAVGWIWNIVKLIGMTFDPITGMLVVRAVGIVFAPLGAVVGFF